MTTVDVRTGFSARKNPVQREGRFSSRSPHKTSLYVFGKDAADVFVENSQTPKSSNKTLNVVRGKKLIKKLFSIPNTTRREKQSTITAQFYTQKPYRGLIITRS